MTHGWDPNWAIPLWRRVDLGVIAIKGKTTLTTSPKLEPYHQMHTRDTYFWETDFTPSAVGVQSMYSEPINIFDFGLLVGWLGFMAYQLYLDFWLVGWVLWHINFIWTFGWVLWHINFIWTFGWLVGFYGISTLFGLLVGWLVGFYGISTLFGLLVGWLGFMAYQLYLDFWLVGWVLWHINFIWTFGCNHL